MKLARYNPNWPDALAKERDVLITALGDDALRIEHVGSTSVPGLQAKSVIDIQISVAAIDIARYAQLLRPAGYKHLATDPDLNEIYPFFHKPSRWPTTHHIHICEAGGEQESLHLAFRNWLRSHPKDRDIYGAMKDELAKDVDDGDLSTIFEYTERKGEWIQMITAKAIEAGLGK